MSEHPPKQTPPEQVLPPGYKELPGGLLVPSSSEENNETNESEVNERAYKDILNPLHVAQLKDDIERAISQIGTNSPNVNKGLDLDSGKKAICEKYIKEYLHIGDPEKTRPISDELRKELEELLSHNFDELEAMATGNNDTDPKPKPTENEPPTSPSPKAPDGEPKPGSDKDAIREEIEDIFENPEGNGEKESTDAETRERESAVEDEEAEFDDEKTEEIEQAEAETETADEDNEEESEIVKRQQTELQEKIDAADKILKPSERARALSKIAKEYKSLEAASRITELAGTTNPLRYLRFITGTDRSEHDRAMEAISKSADVEMDRLTAAQTIKRGNARNRALSGVLTRMIATKPKTVLQLSREMRGPSRGKYRNYLVSQFAGRLPSEQQGLSLIYDELRLDGPISRHFKNALHGVLKEEQIEVLERTLDKMPSRKRDKAIGELAIKHKSADLVREIKSPFIRDKTRKELAKIAKK